MTTWCLKSKSVLQRATHTFQKAAAEAVLKQSYKGMFHAKHSTKYKDFEENYTSLNMIKSNTCAQAFIKNYYLSVKNNDTRKLI